MTADMDSNSGPQVMPTNGPGILPARDATLPVSRSYQLEMFERSMEGNVIIVVRVPLK